MISCDILQIGVRFILLKVINSNLFFIDEGSTEKTNVHPSISRVHILVVTPSTYMAKLYVQAVKELALTCSQNIAAVTLDAEMPGMQIQGYFHETICPFLFHSNPDMGMKCNMIFRTTIKY